MYRDSHFAKDQISAHSKTSAPPVIAHLVLFANLYTCTITPSLHIIYNVLCYNPLSFVGLAFTLARLANALPKATSVEVNTPTTELLPPTLFATPSTLPSPLLL